MNRREFIATSAATVAAAHPLAAAVPTAAPAKPTNVLFILADQWRFSAFGHAGDPNVRTPHFDALAAQGVKFEQVFAANPVCTPNRSCIMTSRYSHQHGMIHNDIMLPPAERCMPGIFADAGYATHYIGKWHMDGEAKPGFVPAGWRRRGVQTFEGFNRGHYYPTGAKYFTDQGQLLHPDVYEPTYQTDLALAFMKRQKAAGGKPFYCYLSWGPPHTPYKPPPNWTIYDPAKIQWRDNVPQAVRHEQMTQNFITGYYGLCSSLDDELGRILKFLDDEDLAQNTLVIFTSDHGDMLGSHGCYYKEKPEEESLHVPLTMRLPGRIKPASKTSTLTSSVDLVPTIASICSLKAPSSAMGRDLSSAALGTGTPSVDLVYAEGRMRVPGDTTGEKSNDDGETTRGNHGVSNGIEWRAIVTPTHKYVTRYDGTEAALWDRQKDPYELNNLVADASTKALRADLATKMKRRGAELGDHYPAATPPALAMYPDKA